MRGRTAQDRGDSLGWVFGALSAALLAYLIVPLLAILPRLSWSRLGETLASGESWRALGLSVGTATISAFLAGLFGIPLAYLLARREFRGRVLVRAAIILPLVLPPIVGGLLLMLVVGPNGLVGRFLDQAGISIINHWPAIVLAQLFVAAPFVVITAETAFRGVDPRLEMAGATLGRAPWYVFRQVTLPLARTGLVAGLVLGWLRALGEFGATAVLAFNPHTLPVATWVQLSGQGLATSLPLAVMSLAITAVALVALQAVGRPPAWQRRTVTVASPLRGPAFAGRRWRADAEEDCLAAEWDRPAHQTASGGCLKLALEKTQGNFMLSAELEADPGILVLFGPSGSGKTTLLNCLAGVRRPSRGFITLDDRPLFCDGATGPVADIPAHLRRVGVVLQDYSLFPHLRMMENVLFGTRREEADRARAREVLGMCRLEGLGDRYPHQLSGGQQQRVALARALVTQPRVLLLDEPFSALDSNVREKLQMDLLRLQGRLGLTILHVTHDLREALVLADRMAVLHEGRIVQVGPKDEVLRRPANDAVARFVGTRNMLNGTVLERAEAGTLVGVGGLRLWAPPGDLAPGVAVQVLIRPEEITPLWDGVHPGDRENVLEAISVAEQDRGLVWRVFLRSDHAAGPEEELVMDVAAHDYEYHRLPQLADAPRSPWRVLVPQGCLHLIERA